MCNRTRFRDGDKAIVAQRPGKCDLRRGCANLGRYFVERGMACEASLLDGTIRHHWHFVLGEPRQQVQLGASTDEIVEDLIGYAAIPAGSDKLYVLAWLLT